MQLGSLAVSIKANDHDLWTQLMRVASAAFARGFLKGCTKVTSHQRPDAQNAVEEWANLVNACADSLAARACQHWPAELATAHHSFKREWDLRRMVCRDFHSYIVQCGLRDVETKVWKAEKDQRRWDERRKANDNRDAKLSLEGIERVSAIPGHALGECFEPLLRWLTGIMERSDSTPMWLTSYQLLIHYQLFTGGIGFEYSRKRRTWTFLRDLNHSHGFLQLASWLQTAIRALAAAHELEFEFSPQLPWGSSFRMWQGCLRLRASPAEFTKVDAYLKHHGAVGIKSVRKSLGHLGHSGNFV